MSHTICGSRICIDVATPKRMYISVHSACMMELSRYQKFGIDLTKKDVLPVAAVPIRFCARLD